MKIVFLDSKVVNQGDLNLDIFKKFGEVEIYDTVLQTDIVKIAKNADIILTSRMALNHETLLSLEKLKLICSVGTGFDMIALETAKKRGITICNAQGYSKYAVAQHVFTIIFKFLSDTNKFIESAFALKWSGQADFNYSSIKNQGLEGKTIGIIGLGQIGSVVAKVANSFGMKVVAYTRSSKDIDGVELVSLDELLKTSDIISLHCPLNEQTNKMICIEKLNMMKKSAILINTARGGLINEEDLFFALENDIIGGAGLDVLTIEPPLEDIPLFHAKSCIITPHIAWATKEARQKLLEIVANNIECYLKGKPINKIV
jgi:glycerate dehydrogenase